MKRIVITVDIDDANVFAGSSVSVANGYSSVDRSIWSPAMGSPSDWIERTLHRFGATPNPLMNPPTTEIPNEEEI